jgi:hypothetical protein
MSDKNKKNQGIPDDAFPNRLKDDTKPAKKDDELVDSPFVILQAEDGLPVQVYVIEVEGLGLGADDSLVFVEGPVTHDTMSAARALGKFALAPPAPATGVIGAPPVNLVANGSLIEAKQAEGNNVILYFARGAAGPAENIVDVTKLTELRGKNSGHAPKAPEEDPKVVSERKKAAAQSAKDAKAKAAAEAKANPEAAKAAKAKAETDAKAEKAAVKAAPKPKAKAKSSRKR